MENIDGNQQWCQSCGMPMGCDDVWYGTNADGTKNADYCSHCWQDGAFTAPDLTMEQMIEICVPHMVADPNMGFTEDTARALMREMLPKLKRWQAGAEIINGFDMDQQWCQSCGMPMGHTDQWLGTNADGTKNPEYCSYCWQDGAFAAPEMTMDEMIEICIPYMVANPVMGFTEESARKLMYETLPQLKRWKKEE